MDKKQTYQKKMETQLNDWAGTIGRLAAKAEKAGTRAKSELQERIRELSAKQEAAQQKLQELTEAGGEAWNNLKAGAERARLELKSALDNALHRFKPAGVRTRVRKVSLSRTVGPRRPRIRPAKNEREPDRSVRAVRNGRGPRH